MVKQGQVWYIGLSKETLEVRYTKDDRVWCWRLDSQGYYCAVTTLTIVSLIKLGMLC